MTDRREAARWLAQLLSGLTHGHEKECEERCMSEYEKRILTLAGVEEEGPELLGSKYAPVAEYERAIRERDEARATKDMHKERQEREILRADALQADRDALRADRDALKRKVEAVTEILPQLETTEYGSNWWVSVIIRKALATE
jgi:hypothetical protein